MKRNSCQSERESLCLLATDSLPESERCELEAHLKRCADCREYLDQLRHMVAPLANWEETLAHIEPSQSFQRRWQNAVQSSAETKSPRPPAAKISLQEIWREWLRPFRYAWAGMAALWLVMASMNFGLSRSEPAAMTAQSSPSPAVLQAFAEERRVLAELVSVANDPVAPPSRNDSRPRSARRARANAA